MSSREEGGPSTAHHRTDSGGTVRTETANPALLALLRENSAAAGNKDRSPHDIPPSPHSAADSFSRSSPKPGRSDNDPRQTGSRISHRNNSSAAAPSQTPKPTRTLTDHGETDASTSSNPPAEHSSSSLVNPDPSHQPLTSVSPASEVGEFRFDPSARSISQTIIRDEQGNQPGHRSSNHSVSATPISHFLPSDTDSASSELARLVGTPSRKSFLLYDSPISEAGTSEEGGEGYYGDEDSSATQAVTADTPDWSHEQDVASADQPADLEAPGPGRGGHTSPSPGGGGHAAAAAGGPLAGAGSATPARPRSLRAGPAGPSPDLTNPQHQRFVTPYGSRRLKDKPVGRSSAVQAALLPDGDTNLGTRPPLNVPKDQAWSAKQAARLRQGETTTEGPGGVSQREELDAPASPESPGSATPRNEESSPNPVDSLDLTAAEGQQTADEEEEEDEFLRRSSTPVPVEEGTSDLPPTSKPRPVISAEQASSTQSVTVPTPGEPQAESRGPPSSPGSFRRHRQAAAPSILKKSREVEGSRRASALSSGGDRGSGSIHRVYVDSPTFTREEEDEYRFVSSRVDNHDDGPPPAHPTYRGMDQQVVSRMDDGSPYVVSRANSRPFKQVRYQDEDTEGDDRYSSRYEDRDELLQYASQPPKPTHKLPHSASQPPKPASNPPPKQFVLKPNRGASADQVPPSVGAKSLALPSGPTFDPAEEGELEKERSYQRALKNRLDTLAERSLEVPRLNLHTESEEFARDSLDIPEDVALDSDRDPHPHPHHHHHHPQHPEPQPRDSLDVHEERRLQQAMRDTRWDNPPTPPPGPPPATHQLGRLPPHRQGYGDPQRQGYGDPQRQGYGDPQRQGYGDPQRQEYANPQRQGYGDPQRQGYGDPQRQGYRDPQGYGDPQRQGYADSHRQGYGDPERQEYADPQRQGYQDPQGYGDPQRQGYGDPQRQGYQDPQRQGYGDPQRPGYRDPQRRAEPQRPVYGEAPGPAYRQGYGEQEEVQGYADTYRQGYNRQGREGYAPPQRQGYTDPQGDSGYVDLQREAYQKNPQRPGQREAQLPYRGDPQMLGYGDFQSSQQGLPEGHWNGYGDPNRAGGRNPYAGSNDVTPRGVGGGGQYAGETPRMQQYNQHPPLPQQGGYYAQETEPPRLPQAGAGRPPRQPLPQGPQDHHPPQGYAEASPQDTFYLTEPRGYPQQEQYLDQSDFGHQSAQPARNGGGGDGDDTDRYKVEDATSQNSTARESSILLPRPEHDYIAQNKVSYGLPKKHSYKKLHAQKKEEEEKLNQVFVQPNVKGGKGQRGSRNSSPSRYPAIAENPGEGEGDQGAEELWAHRSASLARAKMTNAGGKKKGGSNKSILSRNNSRLNNGRLPAAGNSAAHNVTQPSKPPPPQAAPRALPAPVPQHQQGGSPQQQQQFSPLHQPQVAALPSVTQQIVREDGQRISVDVNLRLISPPMGPGEVEGGSTQALGKQRMTGMQYPSENAGLGQQQSYEPPDVMDYPRGGRYSADDVLSSKTLDGTMAGQGDSYLRDGSYDYAGSPGGYSTNPYRKIPPIPTSSEAPRSAPVQSQSQSQSEGGSYMLSYLREKEKTQQQQGRPSYRVYGLRDYQRMQKEVRLGTLGPDLESDVYRERREKMQRQQEYARTVKDKNTRDMMTRKPPAFPRPKESDDMLNKRKLAMEYAKNVPKPMVKPPQPSPYNNYELASKQSPIAKPSRGQHQPPPSSSPPQEPSVDVLDLEKLHERHQQDKRNVEVIRQKTQGVLS